MQYVFVCLCLQFILMCCTNQSICKFVDSNVGKECTWDPNKFLTLCMHSMERSEEDSEAVAFCEMIVMKEWELLVDHAMKQLY